MPAEVIDDFQSAEEVRALRERLLERRARGEMVPARVGGLNSAVRREAVRGDHICWLEAPFEACERVLLQRIEALRLQLNQQTLLGLFDLEMHYACYPAGRCYERHVDQPRGDGARVVSFVLYLNADWAAADGGQLRYFEADGAVFDILPLAGRLVWFFSAGSEHAVLPARRERYSITGWFRRRPGLPPAGG